MTSPSRSRNWLRWLRRPNPPDSAEDTALLTGTLERLPIVQAYGEADRERLRVLAREFLRRKRFLPVDDLELTPAMCAEIAVQAAIPVLELGPRWLRGWSTVIVYPAEFVASREEVDEAGVMHLGEEILGGEAWEYGPLVLSWADVQASGRGEGYNVVIHELAHKLDLLNGGVNGCPPLHRGQSVAEWARVMLAAFEDLGAQVERDEENAPLDPYAASAPEEFFAVTSEYFFEAPEHLRAVYPEVYAQLRSFYRQDPAAAWDALDASGTGPVPPA